MWKFMNLISGNTANNARADIAINDFYRIHKTTFVDVSVISSVCDSNKSNSVQKSITNMERKKTDGYGNRIMQQLGGQFLPCVFSSGGSIGPAAKKIIKIISNKIANGSLEKIEDIKIDIKKKD